MGCNNIKFISNNVRGIKNSDKRIKVFEYLKNKVDSNGMLFFQETHSCEKDEKKWNDNLKEHYSYRMEKQTLAIGYSGAKSFILKEKNGQKWSPFTS